MTNLKQRLRRLIPAVILIAAGATGFVWWRSQESAESTHTLALYGNVDIRQVDLAFNGAERITAMFVAEGDWVYAGQLLATLATERLAARVARAEAQVAAQAAVVARLVAGSRPEEINQARAELELAEAQARDAKRTLARQRELARKNMASTQEVDDALAAAESAAARVKAAEAALVLALAGPRQEDIAAARATLRANEAQLTLAQRELVDAALYAPSDGVIRNRILEPGDMASPQTPVYTLALVDPVWVRAYVDEPDLGKIRPGMRARITTDSFPGKAYPGWIGYISPTAEFTPKSVQTSEIRTTLVYQVRVFVCNPEHELRLGMPATVGIDPSQPATPADPAPRCPEADGDAP
jgi:HlyD family secretion protein